MKWVLYAGATIGCLAIAYLVLFMAIPAGFHYATRSSNSPAVSATATPATGLTEARVREITAEEVNKAFSANPSLTQTQLKEMIDKAVANAMALNDYIKTEDKLREVLKTFLSFSGRNPTVVAGNFPPVLHHGDSCVPETAKIGGCSYDVGVHDDQIGLVFGVTVDWPKGNKSDADGRCDLVVLNPGWYENLHLTDARYEVYTIGSDRAGWIKNLTNERIKEQQSDYGCPAKKVEDIPLWTSPVKSPPSEVGFTGPTSTGIPQQALNQASSPAQPQAPAATQPQAPAISPQASQPSSCADPDTVNCMKRRGAGTFSSGEAVFGFAITLDSGQTYSQCWMQTTTSGGTVKDGVVNPWKTEVASARRCN